MRIMAAALPTARCAEMQAGGEIQVFSSRCGCVAAKIRELVTNLLPLMSAVGMDFTCKVLSKLFALDRKSVV